MTENKRYKISDEAHYVYSDIYDGNEPLRNDEVVDRLNKQDENFQLLIAQTRYINKQRHNLVNFLKGTGHSLEDIKKIMNGDVDD